MSFRLPSSSRAHAAVQSADRSSRPCGREGFALLITVTLLAFLVLLLVSLASLTRVETSVASNTQHLASARQNALAALNIALGDLQKYAGPDQRATARADIGEAAGTVSNGAKRWTGAWGNTSNPQTGISSSPKLLQWLVSGNHETVFDPAAHVSYDEDSFGQVSAAGEAPAVTPDKDITGLDSSVSVTSQIQVDGVDAALLVGPATVGAKAGAESDYVVAPLVDIKVAPAAVPGSAASGGDVTVGRYAYWVGDEGVKARVNMVDPYVAPTPQMISAGNTADTDSSYRLMAPQRLGVEGVTGYEDFPVNEDGLRKIMDDGQLALADPGLGIEARRERFHDLTAVSSSVLADQLRGGLKRDLTFAFARDDVDEYRASIKDPMRNIVAGGPSPLFSGVLHTGQGVSETTLLNERGPTWEQLRSYGRLDGSSALPPGPQTAEAHGIYPILVQARMGFGGTAVAVAQNPELPAGDPQAKFIIHFYPAFVLANPYNVALAPAKYRVRMDFKSANGSFTVYEGGSATPFWVKTLRELFEGQVFELDSQGIGPGEARVFTLTSSPNDETWEAVKTYEFTDEWDGGVARIALDTGTEHPESIFYKSGVGMHMAFSDRKEGHAQGWSGSGGSTSMGGINGLADTLAWTLTSEVDEVYQRFEYIGHAAWRVSTYGIRAPKTAGVADLPNPDNPQSMLLFRIAESGNFGGSGNFTPISVYPYYSQTNWRAPLISRTAWQYSKANSIISFTQDFRTFTGGARLDNWLRPDSGLGNGYSHVEWQGVAADPTAASLPQARVQWAGFDVPRASGGLVSIGQLQHFNAGGYAASMVFPAAAAPLSPRPSDHAQGRPRYLANPHPVGNSRAHPNVDRSTARTLNSSEPYYDQSYLLNRQLFDGYFFSTYPQSGAAVDLASHRLANSTLAPFRGDVALDDPANFRGGSSFDPGSVRLAARNLMQHGAFNVNSTSVEAWRALLNAFNGTTFVPQSDSMETGLRGPFLRSIHQINGSASADNGISAGAWNGFRNLTESQIGALAAGIVAQIKQRGVSVSLADFINRKLTNDNHGLSGPVQAAIDATDINAGFPSTLKNASGANVDPSSLTQHDVFTNKDHLPGHALEGIAGWLSQADVVQSLSPLMTARSDTFRIRTYGETRNPVTQTVEGRAWCEAVVQRLPDYVVASADDATREPGLLGNEINRRFGRKFVVVGFRWLTPQDI